MCPVSNQYGTRFVLYFTKAKFESTNKYFARFIILIVMIIKLISYEVLDKPICTNGCPLFCLTEGGNPNTMQPVPCKIKHF